MANLKILSKLKQKNLCKSYSSSVVISILQNIFNFAILHKQCLKEKRIIEIVYILFKFLTKKIWLTLKQQQYLNITFTVFGIQL